MLKITSSILWRWIPKNWNLIKKETESSSLNGIVFKDLSTTNRIEFKIIIDWKNYINALNTYIKEQKESRNEINWIIPKEILLQYIDDNEDNNETYSMNKSTKTYKQEENNIKSISLWERKYFFFVYKNKSVILDLTTWDTLIADYIYQNVIVENKGIIYIVANSDGYHKGWFFIDMSKWFSHLIKDKYMINLLPMENQNWLSDKQVNTIDIKKLIWKTFNSEILNSWLRYYTEGKYLSAKYSLIWVFWQKDKVLVDMNNYRIIDKILSQSELLLKSPFEEELDDLVISNDRNNIVSKIINLKWLEWDYYLEFNKSNKVIRFRKEIKSSIKFPYVWAYFLYELKETTNWQYKLWNKIAFVPNNDNVLILNLENTNKNNIIRRINNYKYIYLAWLPYLIATDDNKTITISTYNKTLNRVYPTIHREWLKWVYLHFINKEVITPNLSIVKLGYDLFFDDHQWHEVFKIVIAKWKERNIFENVEEINYSSIYWTLRLVSKKWFISYFINWKEQALDYYIKQWENTIVWYKYWQTLSNQKSIFVDQYIIDDNKIYEIYYWKNYFKQRIKYKSIAGDNTIKLPTLSEFENFEKKEQKIVIVYLAKLLDIEWNNKLKDYDLYDYKKLLNLITLKNYKIIFNELRKEKKDTHNLWIWYIDLKKLPQEKREKIRKVIDNIKLYENLLEQNKNGKELNINELLDIDINRGYIEVVWASHSYTDDLEGEIEKFNDTVNNIKLENYYVWDYWQKLYKKYKIEFLNKNDFDLEQCNRC